MMNKLNNKLGHLEKLILKFSVTGGDKDELLNIKEASKLLNLSVSTISSKVCKREIPFNKQGKNIYFYRSKLMKWIKSGRVKTYLEIQNDIEKRSNKSRLKAKIGWQKDTPSYGRESLFAPNRRSHFAKIPPIQTSSLHILPNRLRSVF
jgi:excisionase family DNA binding protein